MIKDIFDYFHQKYPSLYYYKGSDFGLANKCADRSAIFSALNGIFYYDEEGLGQIINLSDPNCLEILEDSIKRYLLVNWE